MKIYLLAALSIYVVIMLLASILSSRRVKSESDFLVAGRRLTLPFSCATLFATWFGAGTILTATDEIGATGLMASALEPYGAGSCLILAGIFFAKPLWEMKLLTIADFFRVKFGRPAEELSIFLTTPGYVAWIAVQLMASAQVLDIFFGIPPTSGIFIMCAIAVSFTLLGGMWSIAITDLIQMGIIVIGLGAVLYGVIYHWGHGSFANGLVEASSNIHLKDYFDQSADKLSLTYNYLHIFLIAALGNIPGQDLSQRIFAAKSSKIARRACILAGVFYILVGSIPVFLGLAARHLLPDASSNLILLSLAANFVNPVFSTLFILALVAAIFSTLDSSILATAGPLSHNLLMKYVKNKYSPLRMCQVCVVLVGLLSCAVALVGEHLYSILEAAYSSGLAIFFAPLLIGLFGKKYNAKAATMIMLIGAVFWVLEIIFSSSDLPFALMGFLVSFISYYAIDGLMVNQTQVETSLRDIA